MLVREGSRFPAPGTVACRPLDNGDKCRQNRGMTNTTKDAPLTNFRVIGLQENWIGINPGTEAARMVPGGSCWHCGTGIAIEVVIKSTETGETHTIGTTCAERVGLSGPELKAMLAEKYAQERNERSAAVRRQREAEAAERETRETAEHGPHGTESRYLSGCYCQPCRKAAPHGTTTRFFDANCHCLRCIDVAMTLPEFKIQADRHVIVDIETGEVVQAKTVDTKYGYRWCVRDGLCWLPVSPARRSTHAKKGYVQAEAPFLVQKCKSMDGRGTWLKPICRIGEPLVDMWGERIER